MLSTSKDVDQFLVLQSKSLAELNSIAQTLDITPCDNKDKLIELLMANKPLDNTYEAAKGQAISIRTNISGVSISGANEFMREVRVQMYKFNKKKEFDLISPKNLTYKQQLNYLPCQEEKLVDLIEMDMILIKPEQKEVFEMLSATPEKLEINFINKPAANSKSFVMLHSKLRQ